ncbi:low molecular weight phosphotyrosine protein phosphatase [Salmonella enterica subsp. enterica serovar Bredeney]|nr:low molecular weight phosphotyrosine protein phosphatase [Salmonella enterica subsp. enterica serovar Bredeney]EHS1318640.1 low molecular weight phosphotyrosine protein phosphatase [Salmonella enterica subsp. enterica serovar Reading]MJU56284.1 low molecular weight phosphotyrosine protein phosphatase [Salmonella enterica subsp. enterica serovar Montevideo]
MKLDSVLVVCTGNICRSPLGEALLRQLLPGKRIASAGTRALAGQAADGCTAGIAASHGVSLTGHRARQFTPALGQQFDLILVMAPAHREYIAAIAPALRGKTLFFGHWIGTQTIPDPYGCGEAVSEAVYRLIARAARCWAVAVTGGLACHP